MVQSLSYDGNFSNGANFHIFRMKPWDTKLKTTKLHVTAMILMHGSGDQAMAFYRYFQTSDALPDTSGPTPVCIISPVGQWGWHSEVSQVHMVCWSMPSASNVRQWSAGMPHCTASRWLLAVLVVLPQLKTKTDYMWSKEAWHWAGRYEYKNIKISSEGLTAGTIYMKICTHQNFPL